MAKEQNSKPGPFPTRAAKAGKVREFIGTNPTKAFKGPSLRPVHVGPKNAPFMEKGEKSAFDGKR